MKNQLSTLLNTLTTACDYMYAQQARNDLACFISNLPDFKMVDEDSQIPETTDNSQCGQSVDLIWIDDDRKIFSGYFKDGEWYYRDRHPAKNQNVIFWAIEG